MTIKRTARATRSAKKQPKKVVIKRPEPVVLVIEGPPRQLTKMEKLVKWWSEFI